MSETSICLSPINNWNKNQSVCDVYDPCDLLKNFDVLENQEVDSMEHIIQDAQNQNQIEKKLILETKVENKKELLANEE